jgi:hypothetical protein
MDTAKEWLAAISWGRSKSNQLINSLKDPLFVAYWHGGWGNGRNQMDRDKQGVT